MTEQNTSRPGHVRPAAPLLVAFAGGRSGPWRIECIEGVSGEPLQAAARLSVVEGAAAARAGDAAWVLRGVTSNERYVTRHEHDELAARQQPLGRPGSTRAALIPIKKSEAWWELAQDERRQIFEESSRHLATSLEYLPRSPGACTMGATWASPSIS